MSWITAIRWTYYGGCRSFVDSWDLSNRIGWMSTFSEKKQYWSVASSSCSNCKTHVIVLDVDLSNLLHLERAGTELLERCAYYAISLNLVTYLVEVLHQGTGQSVKSIFNWEGMLNPLFKRRSCVKVSQPLPPKKKNKQINQKNV
jgi:hypothetical protein